jgi:hypothetical protein
MISPIASLGTSPVCVYNALYYPPQSSYLLESRRETFLDDNRCLRTIARVAIPHACAQCNPSSLLIPSLWEQAVHDGGKF